MILHRHALVFLAMTLLVGVYAAPARAMPAMLDYWRLTCPVKKSKNPLDAACAANAAEKKRYDAAIIKFQEGGAKGAQPKENYVQSLAQVKAASQVFNAKVKKNKADAKANYWLGLSLALLGDDWAVNKLDDAQQNTKDPILTARAELALAEFLFDKKGAGAALDSYKKVLKLKDPQSILYARYKLAWIDYASGVQAKNGALKKQALTGLARISHDTSSSAKKAKKKKGKATDDDNSDDESDDTSAPDPFQVKLAKVVKDDILNLSIDYGNQADVQMILKSAGASDVYATFLERAAYVKWEAGQSVEAYKMFAAAIKAQDKKTKNVQLNLNLAQIAGQLNNVPLLMQNLKIIQKIFLAEKSPWRKEQKPAALKKTDEQLETVYFDYCAALDQAARKDQQAKTLANADEMYKLFLTTFPKSAKAYEARFYDGQILYMMKSYLKSAQAMLAMIEQTPKGRFTKDGLDIMVTAAQLVVDNDKTKYDVAKMGTLKTPRPLPPIRKTYAEALTLYTKMAPKIDKTPAMKFVAAGIYYDYGHYKEAVKAYWSFVQLYPNDPFAKQAAQRLLEYYKLQQTEAGYEKAKAKLAGIGPIATAPELAAYFVKKDKPAKPGKKAPSTVDEDGAATTVADDKAAGGSDSGSDAGKAKKVSAPADDESD